MMKTKINYSFLGLAPIGLRRVVEWKYLLNRDKTLDWKNHLSLSFFTKKKEKKRITR